MFSAKDKAASLPCLLGTGIGNKPLIVPFLQVQVTAKKNKPKEHFFSAHFSFHDRHSSYVLFKQ